MKLSIISFTENGKRLSGYIAKQVNGLEVFLFTKHMSDVDRVEISDKEMSSIVFVEVSIGEWAKVQMQQKNALLFIGACGIAVRAVAPYLVDKLYDSPVLVMDEKGRYVIPIVAGHMGGANQLAYYLAKWVGAEPVITTATDINGVFAVDLFAKKNGLFIENKDGIAKVSSRALAGKEITLSIETGHVGEIKSLPDGVRLVPYPPAYSVDIVVTSQEERFDAAILLKPKEYILGVGCKKGKEADKIGAFILQKIEEFGISVSQILALSSISQKQEEAGLIEWCRKENIPLITYSAEELQTVEGKFHNSFFVEKTVGIANVCERAALKVCGAGGRLICEKCIKDGMTIAIARREWRVYLDEKEDL